MTNGVAPVARDEGMSFSEWLTEVLVRWRLVASILVSIIALTIVLTFIMSPSYRGRATFVAVPNNSSRLQSGLAGLVGGSSGLASQFGLGGLSSDPTTSPEFYRQLIGSRELLTRLATSTYADPRPDSAGKTTTLVALVGPTHAPTAARRLELTVIKLSKLIRATPDTKTNMITVTADFEWPALSSTVVNRVTALVDSFNVSQRQSRARERRLFAGTRVTEAQGTLRTAEDRMRDFLQANRQWQQSPELTFEEGRLRRQLEVENELYLTLRRELEMSRLDEVNDTPVITVVDSAVVPTIRQWPKRTALTIASAFVGLALGVLVAGTLALISGWARRHPADATDLRGAVDDVVRVIPGARWLRRRPAVTAPDR